MKRFTKCHRVVSRSRTVHAGATFLAFSVFEACQLWRRKFWSCALCRGRENPHKDVLFDTQPASWESCFDFAAICTDGCVKHCLAHLLLIFSVQGVRTSQRLESEDMDVGWNCFRLWCSPAASDWWYTKNWSPRSRWEMLWNFLWTRIQAEEQSWWTSGIRPNLHEMVGDRYTLENYFGKLTKFSMKRSLGIHGISVKFLMQRWANLGSQSVILT